MTYILSPSVFYRIYGENTLIFQTNRRKIYIFNAISKSILDCFADYSSIEGCVDKLKGEFDTTEFDLKSVISNFVDKLIGLELIYPKTILSENKNDLELHFKDQLLPYGQLYAVQFEVTFRCNEKCKHCYCIVDKDKKELSTNEIKNILDELYEMNVFEITFTGGDLFVRKDMFEILDYAYSKRFLVTIFTNGIALSDSDLLHLKSLNLKSIHFSIYNHKPEKHDAFTQVKGSFDKTTSVIKKCVNLGIPVNIKTCVVDSNADDIEGILELAKNLSTTIQISMAINAKNDGDTAPFQHRLKTAEDYADVMKLVNKHILIHCSNDYKQVRPDDGKICGAGNSSLNINPYGEVFPCNALLISCGNVREKSISDIWNNSVELDKIRNYTFDKIKGCENCEELTYCNFCPGSALIETGDSLTRYSEACILTNAKKLLNTKKQKEVIIC